jgi:hypothetical protein
LNLTKGKSGTLVVAIVDLKGAFVLACFAFFLLGQVTLTPARIGRMATGQVVGCPSLQQQLLKNILENKERVI